LADGTELHADFFEVKDEILAKYEAAISDATNQKVDKQKGKSEQEAKEELQEALLTVKPPSSLAALQKALATDDQPTDRSYFALNVQ
jgi:hypothetical protein